MDNKKLIEALLYLKGDEGLNPKELKIAVNDEEYNVAKSRKELEDFAKEWNNEEHGIIVSTYNDTFKFLTSPHLKDAISELVSIDKKQKLSQASIETIGIIAYNQPITRSQISKIRGIESDAVVNTLLVKGLIEEKGIDQTPGNPILYGITNKFYDYFQIHSLKELPEISKLNESEGLEEEFDLYSSQREE